jgi:O-antigen/teichoic acid export membrane protein
VTISNALQTIHVGFTPILTPVVAGMEKKRLSTDLKFVYSYCVFMVTLIQLLIGFFIVLFPSEILSIAGKDFIVQPEALGILLLVHLGTGFGGLSVLVLKGMGKSLYTLIMDTISLGLTLGMGYLLIPRFGLVGAALAMLSSTLFSAIVNNGYLYKMGFRLYSSKLISQVLWIVALVAFYIAVNTGKLPMVLWQKIVAYLVIVGLLGLYWKLVKKYFSASAISNKK